MTSTEPTSALSILLQLNLNRLNRLLCNMKEGLVAWLLLYNNVRIYGLKYIGICVYFVSYRMAEKQATVIY